MKTEISLEEFFIKHVREKILKDKLIYIKVHVHASERYQTKVMAMVENDMWKMRIKAKKRENQANEELLFYISKLLSLPCLKIRIKTGKRRFKNFWKYEFK